MDTLCESWSLEHSIFSCGIYLGCVTWEDGNQRHFLSSNFKLSTLRLIDSFCCPCWFLPKHSSESSKLWDMEKTLEHVEDSDIAGNSVIGRAAWSFDCQSLLGLDRVALREPKNQWRWGSLRRSMPTWVTRCTSSDRFLELGGKKIHNKFREKTLLTDPPYFRLILTEFFYNPLKKRTSVFAAAHAAANVPDPSSSAEERHCGQNSQVMVTQGSDFSEV